MLANFKGFSKNTFFLGKGLLGILFKNSSQTLELKDRDDTTLLNLSVAEPTLSTHVGTKNYTDSRIPNPNIQAGFDNDSKVTKLSTTQARIDPNEGYGSKRVIVAGESFDLATTPYTVDVADNLIEGGSLSTSTPYFLYLKNSANAAGQGAAFSATTPNSFGERTGDSNAFLCGYGYINGSTQIEEIIGFGDYEYSNSLSSQLISDPNPSTDFVVDSKSNLPHLSKTIINIKGYITVTNNGSSPENLVATLLINSVEVDRDTVVIDAGEIKTWKLHYFKTMQSHGLLNVELKLEYKSGLGATSTYDSNLFIYRSTTFLPRQTIVKDRTNDSKLTRVSDTVIQLEAAGEKGYTEVNNYHVDLSTPKQLNLSTATLIEGGSPTLPGTYEAYLGNPNNGTSLEISSIDYLNSGDMTGDSNRRHVGRLYLSDNGGAECQQDFHVADYSKRYHLQTLPGKLIGGSTSSDYFNWETYASIPMFKNSVIKIDTRLSIGHISSTNETASVVQVFVDGVELTLVDIYNGFSGFAEIGSKDGLNPGFVYLVSTAKTADIEVTARRVANRGSLTMIADSQIWWQHLPNYNR